MRVLVTGASGYIGGRLVPQLLERGHQVRVLVRDPKRAAGRRWVDQVELVGGDLLQPETLEGVFDGVDVAYYLVHSMYAGRGFAERDRRAVETFCALAARLRHVIYLGGLMPRGAHELGSRVSRHLHSRAEIGRILARHLPSTEFRAGPIIGSGSASFEMLRYLTERMPVMVAPSWVRNEVPPIAIRDVLAYLVGAIDRGPSGVVEIGTDPLTYKQMMLGYARARGLRRLVVPVPPFLPSWLGAGWVGLVTPIPAKLAGPLLLGMAHPLVAHAYRARAYFPEVRPLRYAEAVELALRRVEDRSVETRWSDALAQASDLEYQDTEGMIRETRTLHVDATPEAVFAVFTRLGGERRWLVWNWAWWVRGLLDRLVGGPGLRRGRRHPEQLRVGEALDCWRVESLVAPRSLRLRAEMKLPGQAWLEWTVTPEREGSRLVQTAAFAPRGLGGPLYWYVLYPFHRLIFTDMIEAIAKAATTRTKHRPPRRTRNVFGDVAAYLLKRPAIPTRLESDSPEARSDYSRRILQRLDIDVREYSVLNLHRIGIEAPARYVFEELLRWDGDSSCWPNHLATAKPVDGRLEHIRIRPLGLQRLSLGVQRGWAIKPLFDLTALRIQRLPLAADYDNARYALYSCSGGYPIGVFLLYVRSAIAELGERETTQFFLGVGFDFYGKKRGRFFRPVNRIWEAVHDRVTGNVLNRFKQLCEWRFEQTRAGR